ncbi:MAG TPA: DinB family protein, partial [Candidatus Limnocylindrales bacterium]|nr:DinB family protein [Candidatus Limnocylindrales bacterium]
LGVARADVIAAAHDLLAIPEAALTREWAWIGGSEQEVRYGAYRAAEALEQAEIEAHAATSAADATEREAARLIGPTTAARWDLYGLLLPLEERLLDADPGDGEWSIRLVAGHIISGQRGYGWGSAWWQAQGYDASDPELPKRPPEALGAMLPDEATTEAAGTIDELRTRFDAILDLCAERLAGLPDDRLALGSRWSGFPVTVGFRFGRWPSHIREHAIQVEKTLAMLGHVTSEPARLVRNMLAAYGRAESVVFGRQGVEDAVDRVVLGAAEAREAIHAAREAAGV